MAKTTAHEAFAFSLFYYPPPGSGVYQLAQRGDKGYEAVIATSMHVEQTTGGEYGKVRCKEKIV
jgi:hypothetical protein